ncbi:MAG: TetR family transcriptional regulator [Verrucomicrobiaceae bacterium]|nr:TetR family transcriptional regulator [Verrucomicrobiaceae bacterium]
MPRLRDPKRTRRKVLEASYREFYRHGFQGGSLNRIVAAAGITKGALFHHFAGKNELGYAVLDEFLLGAVNNWWVDPLHDTEDPIPVLRKILARFLKRVEEENPESGFLFNGCPICNFAVEMSPLDEGFRKRIGSIYGVWRRSIFDALKRGQKNRTVREDIDPGAEASFLVAIMAGSASVGKVAQKLAFLRSCIQVARSHVESLLPS